MSQQRKKVFIDISVFDHRWFDDLPLEYQMAYLLLWGESDNVGVWKPHFRKLQFKLKKEIDPDDFLKQVNSYSKRIEVLDNGDWWIIDYLPLQVNTLTPNNRPHISYIEDLHFHGLLTKYAIRNPENIKFQVIDQLKDHRSIEDVSERKKARSALQYLDSKDLVRPLEGACKALTRGWEESKEKDKEQDKEKNQEKDKLLATNSLKANNGSQKKESDFELVGTLIDEKGSLYYHKLAKQLKELIPEDVLDGVSDNQMEEDLKAFHYTIEANGIVEPRAFMIAKAKNANWAGMKWKDFEGVLFETETPF